MKLESLKLEKFKKNVLERDQMVVLKGGLVAGTSTPAGSGCGYGTVSSDYYTMYSYNYGYDVDRGDGYITYHNRTNVQRVISCE